VTPIRHKNGEQQRTVASKAIKTNKQTN